MVSLTFIYDIIFLIIFCLTATIFLYVKRKNIHREGLMFLYKTKVGIKLINYIGGKYKRTLWFLSYIIIGLSYILMIGVTYLIGKSVYIYVTKPFLVTSIIKAPPIAPVIPYFPQLFGLESYFPNFSFTYFIVSISIVALVHEFSHGIFMKYNKVKIKSTGIAFLGPILGAFVEQDEKDMEKKGKIAQMSILGAGVFANILTAIIFFMIWWGLFYVSFIPSGAIFDSYAMGVVGVNSIESINGINITNPTNQNLINFIDSKKLNDTKVLGLDEDRINFTEIIVNGDSYFITIDLLKKQLELNQSQVIVYYDMPAIRNVIKGTIISIDKSPINHYKDLGVVLSKYSPGDNVNIKTRFNGEIKNYNIVMGKNPLNSSKAMMGIGNGRNLKLNMADNFAPFKKPFTEYIENGSFLPFIYYLVFWIFLLNLLVAFFNMLPASILDGGRFFYLTVWGITKNEKIAKKAYKYSGKIILLAFILMIIAWFIGITFGKYFA